ncbi:Lysophospholipid transporter LplT [Rubripirellula lacrimiformis]|uniref:Lysophospholipid transporter LplT n=1 Tax=Rubripirellula lacrimiformis TaxID=1930273 RepID=A0A517N602_9BACT|nr:MFS transporter [Rubripirellula lacrimiformis]QDT02562.1 Lysophospholipid transporter LplT [Rubripirellula lacrimiformis]
MSSKLFQRGFLSLLTAQFFGAMNDNVLKGILTFMVIDGAWAGHLGEGGQGIVGICFTIPFILLSGYGGQLADRFSKRDVTMWVKIAEIPIAIIAAIGFFTGNLWLTMLGLVALTCQSSFFGPAKYGMIPELVDDGDLSRANGTINMMTNVAVIVGTLAAGAISDRYSPQEGTAGLAWLPGAALVLIAICGWAVALAMPRLPVGDHDLKWDWNPLSTYVLTIREMAKSRLLAVMMAWGYFYLLAGLALFIVPEYTVVLGINRAEASVLMGVLGIAIGVGCAVAGLISGHKIQPKLIPIGAAGLIVFFTLLAAVPAPQMPGATMLQVATSMVSLLIFGAGFFAGFYIVPLQALLQYLSPDDERGRFLGTANAVSFAFMTVAALLYWAIRPGFDDKPQNIFYICAALMAIGAAFFLWRLRGTGLLVGSRAPDSSIDDDVIGE